jgi:hypothetical protein
LVPPKTRFYLSVSAKACSSDSQLQLCKGVVLLDKCSKTRRLAPGEKVLRQSKAAYCKCEFKFLLFNRYIIRKSLW